jgi:hypothetical protein
MNVYFEYFGMICQQLKNEVSLKVILLIGLQMEIMVSEGRSFNIEKFLPQRREGKGTQSPGKTSCPGAFLATFTQ